MAADTAVEDAPKTESKTPFSDQLRAEMAANPPGSPASFKVAPPMTPDEEVSAKPAKKEPARAPDDDTPPEVKSEAGKNAWKTYKERLKATEKERDELKLKYETETKGFAAKQAELEQKMTEAKAAYDPVEFERLKKEKDELWNTVRRTKVTELPEFKRNFTEPLDRITKAALESVTPDKRPQLEWLLKQPNSTDREERLNDLTSSLSSITTARLANAVVQVDEIRDRMNNVLAQEKEVSDAYEAQQLQIKERTTAQQKIDAQKAIEEAAAEIRNSKLPGFTEIEGDTAHNAAVAAAFEKAKSLGFNLAEKNDRRGIAKIAHMAVLTETLIPMLQKQFSEMEELKATIAKLQANQPGTRPASQSSGASTPDDKQPFRRSLGM